LIQNVVGRAFNLWALAPTIFFVEISRSSACLLETLTGTLRSTEGVVWSAITWDLAASAVSLEVLKSRLCHNLVFTLFPLAERVLVLSVRLESRASILALALLKCIKLRASYTLTFSVGLIFYIPPSQNADRWNWSVGDDVGYYISTKGLLDFCLTFSCARQTITEMFGDCRPILCQAITMFNWFWSIFAGDEWSNYRPARSGSYAGQYLFCDFCLSLSCKRCWFWGY
jgi:hypothetical protein